MCGVPAETVRWLAKWFAALADENRLTLLLRLGSGEANVASLSRELALPQASVSKHLATLRHLGIVGVRHDGLRSFYRVCDPAALQVCELAATGVARWIRAETRVLTRGRFRLR